MNLIRVIIVQVENTKCKWGLPEDWLQVFVNGTDDLSNNLRLNEISILTFSQFYVKVKQKPIRNSCKSNLWLTL